MAHNETFIAAPLERVFAVLSEPDSYPRWVVGTQALRGVDPGFPAVGTRLHHSVGVGPLTLNDHTEVLDVNPPYRLELRARARPLGTAHIVLLLEPREDGTYLTMVEDAGDLASRVLFNPLTQSLVRGRNAESLRRLKALCEQRRSDAPAPAAAAS